jgi:hypothetical protein
MCSKKEWNHFIVQLKSMNKTENLRMSKAKHKPFQWIDGETMDRKIRNKILEELSLEAWHHAIAGQKLLSRIRDLETMFKAQDTREDKEHEQS